MRKINNLLLIAILLVTSSNAFSQVVGKTFPAMEAVTIYDEPVVMPKYSSGKYTLLGMAFSKKAEENLKSWFVPVFESFIGNPNSDNELEKMFSQFKFDINVFFVPMFTGIKTAGAGKARQKALAEIDYRLHDYILFYKGKLKPYQEALDFDEKDVPYFFVLDENGKIVYATTGGYTNSKMKEVKNIIP